LLAAQPLRFNAILPGPFKQILHQGIKINFELFRISANFIKSGEI